MESTAPKDETQIEIMESSSTLKDQTQIEIKQTQFDFGEEEQKIAFFESSSRKKQDTWVVSVFVILHLVAFFATMFANNCWRESHRQCAFAPLGRFSFQPISENPLLGPSASTLNEMGALRRSLMANQHQSWRLFTGIWLHAGLFHLIINLSSVIFIGIHLEQEFGPFRVAVIYILSAFSGSLLAAIFLIDKPSVASSGGLFGLIGAMFSGLIRNWKLYSDKSAALIVLFCVCTINFALGLLPYINNFSSIGGLISGMLLGFVLFFSPEVRKVAHTKGSLFHDDIKFWSKLKKNLDKPILRSTSLVLFVFLFAGLFAIMHRVNANEYCNRCQFIDCIPSKWWSCSDIVMPCETMVSGGRLTLTCTDNGKFRIFPFSNLTQARIDDVCSLICS